MPRTSLIKKKVSSSENFFLQSGPLTGRKKKLTSPHQKLRRHHAGGAQLGTLLSPLDTVVHCNVRGESESGPELGSP